VLTVDFGPTYTLPFSTGNLVVTRKFCNPSSLKDGSRLHMSLTSAMKRYRGGKKGKTLSSCSVNTDKSWCVNALLQGLSIN
jgi:hypothetical protein